MTPLIIRPGRLKFLRRILFEILGTAFLSAWFLITWFSLLDLFAKFPVESFELLGYWMAILWSAMLASSAITTGRGWRLSLLRLEGDRIIRDGKTARISGPAYVSTISLPDIVGLSRQLVIPSDSGPLFFEDRYACSLEDLRDRLNATSGHFASDGGPSLPPTGEAEADRLLQSQLVTLPGSRGTLLDLGWRRHISFGWFLFVICVAPLLIFLSHSRFLEGLWSVAREFPLLLAHFAFVAFIIFWNWIHLLHIDPSRRRPCWALVTDEHLVLVKDGTTMVPRRAVRDVTRRFGASVIRFRNGARLRFPGGSLERALNRA